MRKSLPIPFLLFFCFSAYSKTSKIGSSWPPILSADNDDSSNGAVNIETILILENKSIEVFMDSIFHKTYYFQTDSDSFVLPPEEFEDDWASKGLFFEHQIYSDGMVREISRPYYDKHNLQLDYQFFDSTDYEIAKGFILDYERLLRDSSRMDKTLELPKTINKIAKEYFEEVNHKAVFLEVRRHLTSHEQYLVQLELIDTNQNTYNFYIFFDKNMNVMGWTDK